jgi:hypothetical protein
MISKRSEDENYVPDDKEEGIVCNHMKSLLSKRAKRNKLEECEGNRARSELLALLRKYWEAIPKEKDDYGHERDLSFSLTYNYNNILDEIATSVREHVFLNCERYIPYNAAFQFSDIPSKDGKVFFFSTLITSITKLTVTLLLSL